MNDFPLKTVEVVCLGTSVALSGLFYFLYRKKRKTVNRLKEAPRLSLDKSLASILNATPGKCLQYVIIQGRVQPVGEPLRSQFQEGSIGVVQKLVLREHKLVWNSLARTWYGPGPGQVQFCHADVAGGVIAGDLLQDGSCLLHLFVAHRTDSERILHQRVNTVPFNLVGSDEAAVRVLCPLEASGLDMEIVHEKFHQASYGFTDIIGQYLSGEKPKGQLEMEEMVKVGATLTGVGELFLDTDCTLKLRPPADGSEFFLTPVDFETMQAAQAGQAWMWRALGLACLLSGVAVLLWAARRHYRHLQARREQERLRREFDRLGEGDELPDNACVICMSRPRSCVLLDCGHVCCCFQCSQVLLQPICPICRQHINRVVPLYQA